MRNLHVLRAERVSLNLENEHEGEVIVAAAYDADNGRIFYASDSCTIFGLNLASVQDQWATSLLEEGRNRSSAILKEKDMVICMEFLLEKEALVVGLAAGDILQLDPAFEEVEVVGVVKGGCVNLVLSPDGGLLVVATGLGQLLLMTQDWDVLYEISLDQPPGSSRSGPIPPWGVQVSWRGDGKYFSTLEVSDHSSSQAKISPMKVWERETGALHSSGEHIANLELALSWNPAGSRIATAYCRPDTNESPVVVLFERNGLKRSSFDILAPPGARVQSVQWNASSELLAILIRCGEWDFIQVWSISNFHWYLKQEWRFLVTEKVKMFWHPEKPLQLLSWTTFGCLQNVTLCWKSAVTGGSTAFVIDGKHLLVTPLSVCIIPPPMCLFKLNFPSPVQTVATLFENTSRCLVAAILSDGSPSVIILPGVESWDDLEGVEISASKAKYEPVEGFNMLRHISWLDSKTLVGSLGSLVCGVQSSNNISLSSDTARIGNTESESLVEFILLREADDLVGNSSAFSEKWMLRLVKETVLNQSVVVIAPNPLNSSGERAGRVKAEAFIQLTDGSVVLYSSGAGIRKLHESGHDVDPKFLKFASPSPWIHVIFHGTLREKWVILIGLDEQGKLQVNDQLVINDCTSFAVHESIAGEEESRVTHLVWTTRLDTLHVINLEEILVGSFIGEELKDIFTFSSSEKVEHPTTLVGKSRARKVKVACNGVDGLRVRPIWERGARLVTTIGGKDVAVILQTMRGNLETIYPRGLVLGAVATALMEENFEDAVLLARRHRINLNVIVDYKGWEEFCQAAGTFVKQLRRLSHVTEVVQALSKENVMETTYKNLIPVYRKRHPKVGSQQVGVSSGADSVSLSRSQVGSMGLEGSKLNKVQGVLSAIRSALKKEVADSPARELCILTTLARSDPPDLEAALERIKVLREAEINVISAGDISCLKVKLSGEAAIKHLIWLSDADSVFNAALGLYDLHIVAMVAAHSQKDPKEFLPLLEELQNMEAAQMRYKIDCRLGRYESALRNCADIGADHFAECIQLVKANPALFPLGLQIFGDGEKRSVLLDAWGHHFLEEDKFEDAAAAFCACSRFDKALDAYRLAGLWESVMTMGGLLSKSSTEIVELAAELRDELQAMGRPREAAKLALDYCGDVQGAITLLLDAREWLEVARLAYLHGKGDLVSKQLAPALLESANTHVKELDEGMEKVGKYLARFLAIHQRRLLLRAKLKLDEEGKEAVDDDASSDISLASSSHSSISGLSAYTQGSSIVESIASSVVSKGRRRQARAHKSQGGRIRAGSPGEELALVEHLEGMALGKTALDEQRLLLQGLMHFGHESTARHLQQAVSRFISGQQDAVRQTKEKLFEEAANKLVGQEVESPALAAPKDPVKLAADVQWQLEILRVKAR